MYEKQNVGNIVVITKNTCYFTLHRVRNIDLHNAENSISGPLEVKIFWGEGRHALRPPKRSRLRRSYLITPLKRILLSIRTPLQKPQLQACFTVSEKEKRKDQG